VNYKHDHSGSKSRKHSSQSYVPAKGLLPLEQWSSVCPRRDLQTRGEIVSVKCYPSYSFKCLSLSQAIQLRQEWLKTDRGKSLLSVSSLVVWLVGWLVGCPLNYFLLASRYVKCTLFPPPPAPQHITVNLRVTARDLTYILQKEWL